MEPMRVCVARQAIFDGEWNTFAYEILYRRSEQDQTAATSLDADEMTREVMRNMVFGIGLQKLLAGTRGFLNIPQTLLTDNILEALPRERICLEILETVEPNELTLAACQRLREEGFTLVLDDYCGQEHLQPFLDHVNLVKIDTSQTEHDALYSISRDLHACGIKVVAEKLETQEEFEQFRKLGFDYFQGYFLEKPVLVSGTRLENNQVQKVKLLRLLGNTEFDWIELERFLSHDPALAYQLVRYANSARFGGVHRVDSLRRCIALLGATETRRLLLLLHLIGSGNVRSNTLVRAAVMRARMMETIAAEVWPDTNRDEAAFLTGLFSQIEAIMAVPFAELAPHLALSADIEAAISGNTTSGFPADLLALVKAYERGEWARAEQLARELPLSLDLIADIYLESSAWSRVDF